MSTEIKLDYSQVKSSLNELNSVATEFESSLSSHKERENMLDMVNELNELKQSFDELISSYQQLLLNNTNTALQAVETMRETDETLAFTMK